MTPLDAIYAQVPEVDCKGLCQKACGPIAYTAAEADALQENGYNEPTVSNDLTCSYLSENGRCLIYAVRPLVCRLFGAVRALKCPHGCKPKDGYLSDEAAQVLLLATRELSQGRPNKCSLQESL